MESDRFIEVVIRSARVRKGKTMVENNWNAERHEPIGVDNTQPPVEEESRPDNDSLYAHYPEAEAVVDGIWNAINERLASAIEQAGKDPSHSHGWDCHCAGIRAALAVVELHRGFIRSR